MSVNLTQPIFFERNRVGRVYVGGKLFGDFFGDGSVDGLLPEEWIASTVRALNKGGTDPKEGVSRVRGTDVYFDELLKMHRSELIGPRENLGLLVKMLDSAIRLPVQVHPDKGFSRRHFGSDYGKAESWIVVGVREGARIYLGFNDSADRVGFERAIELSRDKVDGFGHMLNEIAVSPGDCFFIPPNIVHAIGPGCLILEIMEPTDFTISPEHFCGDYELDYDEMYLGLDKETALSVFDFNAFDAKKLNPKTLRSDRFVTYESIVDESVTDCFAVNRLRVNGGKAALDQAPAIYVVTQDRGLLVGDGYERPLVRGDYFFLPYAAMGRFEVKSDQIELYECLPPKL